MKVVITSPVEHDGKTLPVDKPIDLADDVAEALVKAGAAEVPAGKKPKADDTQPEA